ncbi:Protein export cytoplasm protein SecA ATPase RNA helicase [Rhodopirellula islandica]|uniref:Protein translocase subunit SecA n=1 Tax=Rhodopirellula islandica TaxID=595434 RepID=A0A0J1BGG4_RHOIS|nr:hypothetical protein [Rhodopirellula islandica]KLU05637.1 Protein export cytoplasm protein SecA ATPase RNA helicase [Rhodopirellula islandica]
MIPPRLPALSQWLGFAERRKQASCDEILPSAKTLACAISSLSDSELRWHANLLRDQQTGPHSACLSERSGNQDSQLTTHAMAFAVAAIQRQLGYTVYDVQLQAALVMSSGQIAEMQTGEGKTITGAVATIIHAMRHQQVHVATSNAYLARRDWELLAPVFDRLALSSGHSSADQSPREKRAAYQCDIVFATGYQFGFDYLRDQITLAAQPRKQLGQSIRESLRGQSDPQQLRCQTRHQVAIVDEIDSVLIDEAMTPLVLSQQRPQVRDNSLVSSPDNESSHQTSVFDAARACMQTLVPGTNFQVDSLQQTVQLTELGIQRAFEWLQTRRIKLSMPWPNYIQTALRAECLLTRDIDYVVRDGKVQIVDSSTGRIVPDRQWRSGLHQAVETKEHVPLSESRRTQARMSRQRYFARYETLCGMTGTASGHEREWKQSYALKVHAIPTRLPCKRRVEPTLYFADHTQKLARLADEVSEHHQIGQPILIGTRNILQTKQVSKALMQAGLNHHLLNGVQDETEAALIAAAGTSSAITVATNMAGRGTDISVDERALAAGGLHVIGLERNLSARIDRQLLGRAARQGQPGSGRFYVSADDELVQRHDPGLQSILSRLKSPIPNEAWDRRIQQLQTIAERENFRIRKQTAQQEEWLDELRQQVA